MLKPDRVVLETDISLTCPTVAERGLTLVHSVAGSGIGIGDVAGAADLVVSPSGYKVAGLLMNDMVSVDQTRYHLNFHKDVMPIGSRCTLLRKGTVTTDKVTGTPTAGSPAYLTSNGVLTPTMSSTGGLVATPRVGSFEGGLDENGYAKVSINLPI